MELYTISVRDLAILIDNHPVSRTAFAVATPCHPLFSLDHTEVLDSECDLSIDLKTWVTSHQKAPASPRALLSRHLGDHCNRQTT